MCFDDSPLWQIDQRKLTSTRFKGTGQDIQCALGDTVLNESPSIASAEIVSAFRGLGIVGTVEEPWPRCRMPDSGAREPGFESSTYDGAVDGDTLWRQQNKILVIVLGNKL